MSERSQRQEPLTGFPEMVEPIVVLEIGCGVRSDGRPNYRHTGRLYDLPYHFIGIEREEELVDSTRHLDEVQTEAARKKAGEAGIIFGNAANIPFEDESVDVIAMRSIFGQFTGKDFREFDNIVTFGLMEAFRVLKPGGIIGISEENTPWDNDKVFDYLNAAGFTVIDYAAMQKDWRVPESRAYNGRSIGDFRNVYAPENEEWLRKLQLFYGDDFRNGHLSLPSQYLMLGQKQQPATTEYSAEWREWSVGEDRFDHRGLEATRHQKTYKCGTAVEQEYLPEMHAGYNYQQGQGELFYMQPRSFF